MRIRLVVIGVAILLAGEARAGTCTRVPPGTSATCALQHGGRAREYRLYVPRAVASPAPVVLNLHGRKGIAEEQETRLRAEADRHGFILVSPQGYERSWNAGVGFGPAYDDQVDDVGFIRAVIAELPTASATPIDARRVYATGFSNGARMVHRLACEASDVIAAVASVAGPIADRNEQTGARAFECKPGRAVPVMIIHGTADLCTPYAGGTGLDTTGNVATPQTASGWAQRDGCTTTTTHRLGSTRCEIHGGCADGAEVALCTIENGGHVWPGGPTYPLWKACGGTWPNDFQASEQMWTFFVAHPLRTDGAVTSWRPLPVAGSSAAGADDPQLDIKPVESLDLPFDRSQLTLTVRGTGPSSFDAGGKYQDGSLAVGGAISLYSRLYIRPGKMSALRVMAQFRIEGERVTADMFTADQQVTKAALGIATIYLSPARNFYAVYAGASIAESRDTLTSPEVLPTVLGLGTLHTGKKLYWIYGGGFGYAAGRPWLLPAVGVMWKLTPSWTFTTLLPVFVDLRHKISRKVSANLALSVSGDRFNFANQGDFAGAAQTLQLRIGQARIGIGVNYRWTRRWSLRGELGAVGPRKLSIVDGDAMVLESDSKAAGYLSTSVNYAFGTAPI